MAQSTAIAEFNTFVQGLITEASPLVFPENASLDEENMVLNREGSRQRRLGMDYEVGYVFKNTSVANSTFQDNNYRTSFFRWDNVDNNPSVSLGVVQVGENLWFLDLYSSAPSSSLKNGGSSLSPTGLSFDEIISFTSIGGKLIGVYNTNKFAIFSYDVSGDSVSVSYESVFVRDIWGVEDSLEEDERPLSLTGQHHYNLHNQGWPAKNYRDTNGKMRYPHVHFFNKTGVYPSNADIWYFAQQPDGSLIKYEPATIEAQWFGNTPAPKGYYTIDLFARSQSRTSKSSVTTPIDITYGGFTAIASFAGRLFLGGIDVSSSASIHSTAPRLENMVVFSQVADSDDKLGNCYQTVDPTEQDGAGLLATDGGTITIPEASRIFKLIPVGKQLVVLAENGIWSISGSDEGFSATNFQVTKITNVGVLNPESVVEAEGLVFYWSKAGIYVLSPDKITGELSPSNMSEGSIQTLYEEIPSIGRTYTKVVYDEVARKIKWLYNDQVTYDGLSYLDRFNKELVFDLTLKAFYKNAIPSSPTTPTVVDYVSTPNYLSSDEVTQVVVGADTVVTGVLNVATIKGVRTRGTSTTKYLTLRPGTTNMEFTLSEYRNSDFLDWYTEDSVGTDAEAYLETGYFTGGDSQRDKSSKYLTVHCKRTEEGYVTDSNGNIDFDNESGCLLQGRWDFTDSSNSGKWSDQFQAYRLNRLYIPEDVNDTFDYGYNIVTTKNKLRGNGKALRIRFDSEPGKDLYIYGWGLSIVQENDV